MTLTEKKRLYVELVETLARYGYDISDMFFPNYSKIDFELVKVEINRLNQIHE
jgi:hypothetical protein